MTVSSKLRHILVTIFVCALPPAAHAEFLPVEPNLKRLHLPQTLAKASVRLQPLTAKGEINNDCTAVVISDKGHILTAAHCLYACLRRAGAYQEESPTIQRLIPSKLASIECPVLIDKQPTGLKVLATADCIDAGETKARPDPSCVGLDVALGQITQDLAPVCAPLAPSAAPQYAFALSYPFEKTLRLYGGEVKELTQYFSEGQLITFKPICDRRMEEPRFPEDEKPGPRSLGPPEVIRMYEREVTEGKQIQMTVDIIKGSSGAPIFDAAGRVLGIAKGYSLKRHNYLMECAGATFMAPFNVADLASRFPNVDLKASTDCAVKRAH